MKNLVLLSAILLLIACYKSNSSKDPAIQYSLLERNESLKNGKEWENVHNLYTRYINEIRNKPNNAKTYAELAELFMLEARVTGEHGHYYSTALHLIEKMESIDKEDKDVKFRALSDKASILLSLHQFNKAKEAATEAIKINPYNAQIYGALIDANVELGNYKEAVAFADKMVSIRPDLRSYSRVSYLREIYGDLDGAIDAMKQAVDAGYPGYEESAWTRLHLASLYKKSGNIDEAIQELHTILAERPNYAFAKANLAEIEMDKNNFIEAEKLLEEAIVTMPEVSFYITKAEYLKKQGKMDEVKKISNEIIEMLQDDEKSGHKMDLTYAQVYKDLFENHDKALLYAQKEYDLRPNNLEVNQFLVDLYSKMGNLAKANEHKSKTNLIKI